MYVERVPNRNSPPAVLLRESYREFGKSKNSLAPTSPSCRKPPSNKSVFCFAAARLSKTRKSIFKSCRSLPHGHVAAILSSILKLGLDKIIDTDKSRQLALVLAMIVSRIIEPGSKLATARGVDPTTAHTSLGEQLNLKDAREDELYEAMDWLFERQQDIEDALAKRHLQDGTLVLYDVTSTYFKAAVVLWPNLATAVTGKKTSCKLSSDSCARQMVVRWP